MKKKYIIACSKKWFSKFQKKNFSKKYIFIFDKKKITYSKIKKINPEKIFFPHWSHKVPNLVHKNFDCICFHISPLPYGRGGSPIQNLIIRRFKSAPVCALKMTNHIDAGSIYLKKRIKLNGSLDEIFLRMSRVIKEMIFLLSKKKITPKYQLGKVFTFKRLSALKSKIKKKNNINFLYDHIRMLDNEEYPKAFINYGDFKLQFSKAKLVGNKIISFVEIRKKISH